MITNMSSGDSRSRSRWQGDRNNQMNDDKFKLSEVLQAFLFTCKDIVYELKNLRKTNENIKSKEINLATSGIVNCPKCGAPFEDNLSKCGYCGYVSIERDKMLERLRAAERGVDSQIKQEQNQLKKLLMIPLFIAIPLLVGLCCFVLIELIGFILLTCGPLIM